MNKLSKIWLKRTKAAVLKLFLWVQTPLFWLKSYRRSHVPVRYRNVAFFQKEDSKLLRIVNLGFTPILKTSKTLKHLVRPEDIKVTNTKIIHFMLQTGKNILFLKQLSIELDILITQTAHVPVGAREIRLQRLYGKFTSLEEAYNTAASAEGYLIIAECKYKIKKALYKEKSSEDFFNLLQETSTLIYDTSDELNIYYRKDVTDILGTDIEFSIDSILSNLDYSLDYMYDALKQGYIDIIEAEDPEFLLSVTAPAYLQIFYLLIELEDECDIEEKHLLLIKKCQCVIQEIYSANPLFKKH